MLNDLITWVPFDKLPKIPSNLLSGFDRANTPNFSPNINRTFNPSSWHWHQVNKELETWLRSNIIDDALNYMIAFYGSHKAEFNFDGRCPHHDLSRKYNLIYVLEPGGTNVSTVFYSVQGKPVDLSEYTEQLDYSSENLSVIDSVTIAPGTWVLLNTKICHSVNGISDNGIRSTVQISLNAFPKNL